MSDFHMSGEAFRNNGRAVIDWIADYLENVERLPVRSRVAPGELRAALPASPPEHGEPFARMLADVETLIVPGLTHWQHPAFFAYFPANNSGPSILGELLSAGLGVQGMLWSTSPACTELETQVLDWLLELLGLPARFRSTGAGGGVIQDSASSATLCALLAARERATAGQRSPEELLARLRVYASEHAHSSVEKAVRIAGLGADSLQLIPTDDRHALRIEALRDTLRRDREAGGIPVLTVATVGTTSSAAVDPLPAIADVLDPYDCWLHVDAAMTGTAAVCPEFRWIHDGVDRADSYCVNPHKWMFTNFDCDAFYVADRQPLITALSVLPEYLRNQASASGEVIDYRDWQIPLGRRFRALKLWFVIRHYGVQGLRHHVREHVQLAQEFADLVRGHPDFELAAPSPLNLVCFRHRGGDLANERLVDRLNRGGRIFLTHTRLDGRYTVRFSVGQWRTRRSHVLSAWSEIVNTAAQLGD